MKLSFLKSPSPGGEGETPPDIRPYVAAIFRGNRLRFALIMALYLVIVLILMGQSWLLGELIEVIASPSRQRILRDTVIAAALIAGLGLVQMGHAPLQSRFVHQGMAQYKETLFAALTRKNISAFAQSHCRQHSQAMLRCIFRQPDTPYRGHLSSAEAMNVLLDSSKCRFTKEQLEDLYGAVDDEVLGRVAARNKIRLFEDDEDEEIENETGEEEFFDEPVASAPKIGFFAKLFAGIGIADALSSSHASHPGHCTGDCANCPPHYGYRYGRWYYGHGHVHGCEFGGNKGDGSL